MESLLFRMKSTPSFTWSLWYLISFLLHPAAVCVNMSFCERGEDERKKWRLKCTNRTCLLHLGARTCRDFSCGSCDDDGDGTCPNCILDHSAELYLHGCTGEERKVLIMPLKMWMLILWAISIPAQTVCESEWRSRPCQDPWGGQIVDAWSFVSEMKSQQFISDNMSDRILDSLS